MGILFWLSRLMLLLGTVCQMNLPLMSLSFHYIDSLTLFRRVLISQIFPTSSMRVFPIIDRCLGKVSQPHL